MLTRRKSRPKCSACPHLFAEENGSIVNSGRWLQWHWKGADAPGIAVTDGEILAGIFTRLRKMYAEEADQRRSRCST